MKVIFLDFDGVLAPYGKGYQAKKFSKPCVESLNEILKDCPEAKIVVSSTWRRHGLEYVKEMLKDNGIDSDLVTDITPKDKPETRRHHIHEWLADHKDIDRYVILDDDLHLPSDEKNMVRPNKYIGLTMNEAKKAVEILK